MSSDCKLSIGSYNILNPYHAVKWKEQDGLTDEAVLLSRGALREALASQDENAWRIFSNWDLRCPLIAKNIEFSDIVCLQEVSSVSASALQSNLPGYKLGIVAYHSSDHLVKQFGNAIFYREDRMSLMESFEVAHVMKDFTRKAACGLFESCGKTIKVASVHLAGYNPFEENTKNKEEAKELGFSEMTTYVTALENDLEGVDALVFAGDFNEDQSEKESPLYRVGALQSQGYFFDGNFEPTEPAKGRRIDWLGCKPLGSTQLSMSSLGLEKIQQQASDHLMTGALIHIN